MRLAGGILLLPLLTGCSPAPPPPLSRTEQQPRIQVVEKLNCNQLVKRVRPVYPQEARKRGIRGTVLLEALITKTGQVQDTGVLRGDPLLVPAAIEAVRQWRYTPCVLHSEAVEVKTQIEFHFPP